VGKQNTVKLQNVQLTFDNLNLQAHNTEHYSEIIRLYEKYSSLKITLEEYQDVTGGINSPALLNKALSAGQINISEYFIETNYFHGTRDTSV